MQDVKRSMIWKIVGAGSIVWVLLALFFAYCMWALVPPNPSVHGIDPDKARFVCYGITAAVIMIVLSRVSFSKVMRAVGEEKQ
jgi:DMSO/TMAO reductase YedYZ heme-binding membrane subunit